MQLYLVVESFGRLGVEGSKFIDQLAASSRVVGGDGGSMGRKGLVKERLLLQINRLGNYTGRHFEEAGITIQTPAQGSSGIEREQGGRR